MLDCQFNSVSYSDIKNSFRSEGGFNGENGECNLFRLQALQSYKSCAVDLSYFWSVFPSPEASLSLSLSLSLRLTLRLSPAGLGPNFKGSQHDLKGQAQFALYKFLLQKITFILYLTILL